MFNKKPVARDDASLAFAMSSAAIAYQNEKSSCGKCMLTAIVTVCGGCTLRAANTGQSGTEETVNFRHRGT